MALPLPKNTRIKLINALSDAIYSASVFAGAHINPFSVKLAAVQSAIQPGSPLDQSLCEFLGEKHVTTFIQSELRSLSIAKHNLKTKRQDFSTMFTRSHAESISKDLITAFESLPWNYDFLIEVPGFGPGEFTMRDGVRKLSPSIRLVSGTQLKSERNQGVAPNALASLTPLDPNWNELGIYAQISVSGYLPKDLQSETMQSAHEQIFSLFGLLIALDILETDYLWINGSSARNVISILQITEKTSYHFADSDLDSAYQELANDLGYGPRFIEAIESTDGGDTLLKEVEKALTRSVDKRLCNAARWFFDSHAGNNDQVKFVQVMIAFEILLGDEKMGRETGLSTLLANRCAYMIGATSHQRSRIISDFKEGYDIRSRIVHAGANRLTHSEKVKFRHMQRLCALVIRHEVKALSEIP